MPERIRSAWWHCRTYYFLLGGKGNVEAIPDVAAIARDNRQFPASRCRGARYLTGALSGELVMYAALGGGQRVAGATPAELDQLGGDRHRGLLRCPGSEIKPDRRAQAGQLVLGQPGLA